MLEIQVEDALRAMRFSRVNSVSLKCQLIDGTFSSIQRIKVGVREVVGSIVEPGLLPVI